MSRVAAVTGGTSGIGLGVARQLANDSRNVGILDRNGTAAVAAAADLQRQGAYPYSDGGAYITGQVIGVNGGMCI